MESDEPFFYIILGTGRIGKKLYELLGEKKIVAFCDNSIGDENHYFMNKPIIPSYGLKKFFTGGNYRIVVASTKLKNVAEMVHQLDEMELPFVLFEDVASEIIRKEAQIYEKLNEIPSFHYVKQYEYLIAMEKFDDAGEISSYLWQDFWGAKAIIENRPLNHYDIGSRIDGFITHLLCAQISVTMLDIRPFPVALPNLSFVQSDATELREIEDESVESLSALCSLEHFGLGRYGDGIDPNACFKCFDAIQKKMKKGGLLYISVPIGKEHLEFNAHRVFKASTIVDKFHQMELLEFSSCLHSEIEENIPLHKYDEWNEFGGERFGLFRFRKK